MSRVRRTRCRCAIAVAFVAAACAASAEPTDAAGARATGSVRLKQVDRSSPGKPQPPIAATYRLSAPPALGVPLRVIVTARADASLGPLSIEVSTAAGASVSSPPRVLAGAAPDEYAWEISVAPLSSPDGRVNVLVKSNDAARSLSVLLRATPRAQAAQVRVSPNGERFIALPVEESSAGESHEQRAR